MKKLTYKCNGKTAGIDNFIRLSDVMKISVLSLLILIGSGFKCRSAKRSKEVSQGKEDVLKLLPGPNNPRNSEGDFITLKDGRILFIYTHYTGSSGGDNDNAYLAGRYSSDKGKTWSKDVKIIDQEGIMNVMSVSLLRLQNGKIALFYLKKNSETDCIPMIRISNDEAKSWSDPLPCITDKEGYFVLNNNRVIQLQNGRLLLAVALHQSPGETKANSVGRLWSYFSDDNGKSWKSSQEVPNPDAVVTQEPGMVELKNGDILMFIRTTSGVQYFSFSKNKGETWSAVKPSNIKSPCSPAIIVRIPSTGYLLMVWNDNGIDQKRTPLNIAISKDEAKTWINNKILENRSDGVYCYPALLFVDKNDVLLHYFDFSVMGSTIVRMTIDWIYK
ncbi:MAG: exo-alpha-sialidase [Bacteroidales bacterium]|nr:exo-alpha-sialidase [Bacteroidales bacterium]